MFRGHTELHEFSAELQPIQLRTHLQTWGKSQGGEEGGEAPPELRKADDLLHLVHRAEPWVRNLLKELKYYITIAF